MENIPRYYLPRQDDKLIAKQFVFGAGENHIKIAPVEAFHVEIRFRYQGDASMMQLLLLVDALRRANVTKIDLLIPYFPGARQDRVCNVGEPLSVKVYADLINAQNFNKVVIFDPHSDVVVALVNNVEVVKNHKYVEDILSRQKCVHDIKNVVLISPDAGANKKIFDLSKYLGGLPVIRADKIRDVRNGEITDTEVFCGDAALIGKTAIIVDDICAGGRTFIELAKKLKQKGCTEIILIVSHFEGSAKYEQLNAAGIDKLFFTNSNRMQSQPENFKWANPVKDFDTIIDVFRYLTHKG